MPDRTVFRATVPVRHSEPVFRGHFPGRPILPGVMLLGFVRGTMEANLFRRFEIRRIPSSRFSAVVDGECDLSIEATTTGALPPEGTSMLVKFTIRNESILVAQGEMELEVAA